MKRFLSLIIVLMFAVIVAGCPKKPTIVKEEAQAPAVDAKAQEEKEAAEAKTKAEAEARARKEAEEKATAFTAEDIHFDFDRYDIKGKDRETLKSLADWLAGNKDSKIVIEGHCDDRGSNDYNLALGDRRAHSAKQYLMTLGVIESRIKIVSYGEEKPLCKASSEDCWGKNRRGHFVIQDTRGARQ